MPALAGPAFAMKSRGCRLKPQTLLWEPLAVSSICYLAKSSVSHRKRILTNAVIWVISECRWSCFKKNKKQTNNWICNSFAEKFHLYYKGLCADHILRHELYHPVVQHLKELLYNDETHACQLTLETPGVLLLWLVFY